MYSASLHHAVDAPWTAMEPIRVGAVPTGLGTPGAYMTVERDGKPFARIDAYPSDGGPFVESAVWSAFVALGWGGAVYVVNPATRRVLRIDCATYFGHLYPFEDKLLIASASDLACLTSAGTVDWRAGPLGVDGVVVDRVADGVVVGRGDWDPPGGWKPFRLSLASGTPAAG